MDILSRFGYKNKNTVDMRPAEAQQRDNLPEITRYKPAEGSFKIPEATPIADAAEGALAGIKGLGEGVTNFDAGAIQALLYGGTKLGVVDPATLQNYQGDIAKLRAQQEQTNPLGSVGREVGNIIPSLALGGAAKSGIANLALQTGLGGVYGAMAPAQDQAGIEKNVLTGAGIGAVAGSLGAIPQAAKGLFSRPVSEAQDILQTSQGLGIKPTVGQITGNVPLRSIENVGTSIPLLGTFGAFNKQLQAVKNGAEDLIKANAPLNEVNKNIYEGLVASKTQKVAQSNAMVDEFTALANQSNQPVPFTNTTNRIHTLITGKDSLWHKIGTAEKDIAEDTVRNIHTAIQEANNTQTAAQAIDLRKLLLASGRESQGPVKHVYNELAKAVDNDISAFATQNSPELADKYHKWGSFYKQEVLPFTSGKSVLKTLTNPQVDLDTIFSKVVKKDSFYRASTIAKNLPKETNEQVAGTLLGKAFKDATDQATGNFNPNSFINNVDKLGQTKQVFLGEATKSKLNAFSKVLKALDLTTESATQGIGSSANMALRTGGTIGLLAYSPPIAASIFLLSHALTSPKTSSALIKLARLDSKSQAFKRGISNLQFTVIKELNKHPENLPDEDLSSKIDILTRLRSTQGK